MKRTIRVGVVLFSLMTSGVASHAMPAIDEVSGARTVAPKPGELTLTTDRAVVFKDGYALIVKTATGITGPDGTVYTDQVPDAAVLGCFWATSTTHTVRSMNAEWVKVRAEAAAESAASCIADVLAANKGKRVTLATSGPIGPIVGRLVEVLGQSVPPPAPGAESWDNATPVSMLRSAVDLTPRGGDLAVIDREDGTRLIFPIGYVQSVSGEGLATTMTRRTETVERVKRLSFRLAPAKSVGDATSPPIAPGTPVTLQVFYFAPGVRWIPTYRVNASLTPSQPAEISLQAEVLNELEDLTAVSLDLVVGVPSFRFKEVISPLALESQMRSALAAAAPQLMGQMANSMFAQRSSDYPGAVRPPTPAAPSESVMSLAPELSNAGSSEQDLFVYSLKGISVAKGARAAVPLWSVAAPARDLYTLDLRLTRGRDGVSAGVFEDEPAQHAINPNRSPQRLATTRIWHQIELSNQSATPWTTGAALLMRGQVPLGQDILAYTSVGTRTLLPVTVAPDMRSTYEEEEIVRVPAALKWNGDSFALIRKRVTLTVTNSRAMPSPTRVSLSLGGKADKASDGAVVRVNDFRAADWTDAGYEYRSSMHSSVDWDLTIAPAETKTLTFELSYYAR